MADTGIYMVIDGSGSMSDVKNEVVQGINEFIDEQKQEALNTGDSTILSLVSFDSNINEVYMGEDISLVSHVTLNDTYLGGGTALFDAIGRTLTRAENDGAKRNVVVIYTDGEENQSTEFNHKDVEKLLKKYDKTGDWQFIYLGAEFGAFQTSASYGAMASSASTSGLNTSKASTMGTFKNVSQTINHYRTLTDSDRHSLNTRGGLVADAAVAGVDWDSVKEETDVEDTNKN